MAVGSAQYCDYFGFSRDPFSIAPDPSLLYPSDQHLEALSELEYGLSREGGFILLTGEVGTGKTTLTRLFLGKLEDDIQIVSILNSKVDSRELLTSLCRSLGVEIRKKEDSNQIIVNLNNYLSEVNKANSKVIIVIEEAQNLATDVLETLRLLSNLETDTRKYLHILLVAQPELLVTLAQQDLRQLKQRIIARYHLKPLAKQDFIQYLDYRIDQVGGQTGLFSEQALTGLFNHSRGVPRLINLIAERGLLAAYNAKRQQVLPTDIQQAAKQVFGDPAEGYVSKQSKDKQSSNTAKWLILVCLFIVTWFAYQFISDINSITKVTNQDAGLTVKTSIESIGTSLSNTVPEIEQGLNEQEQSVKLSSPVQSLFGLWRPQSKVKVSELNLCDSAPQEGLRCLYSNELSVDSIIALDRVGLLTLQDSSGKTQRYLLRSVNNDNLTLDNNGVAQILTIDEFSQQWLGDYLLLWQPPLGYLDVVVQGQSNRLVVDWLLRQLQIEQPESERLITGGRYSTALMQRLIQFQNVHGLVPDGILGQATIIHLNNLSTGMGRLSSQGQF